MSINWDNIERLRTRDGRKVLAAKVFPAKEGVLRNVNVVLDNDPGYSSMMVFMDGRIVIASKCDVDIIELPPDPPAPREIIRWIHEGAFVDDAYGFNLQLKSLSPNYVRVRIIEEPEPPQS